MFHFFENLLARKVSEFTGYWPPNLDSHLRGQKVANCLSNWGKNNYRGPGEAKVKFYNQEDIVIFSKVNSCRQFQIDYSTSVSYMWNSNYETWHIINIIVRYVIKESSFLCANTLQCSVQLMHELQLYQW